MKSSRGYAMAGEKFNERRKEQRFQAKERVFAFPEQHVCELGQIIDISRDGLAFQYIDDREPSTGSFTLNLLGLNSIPSNFLVYFIRARSPVFLTSSTIRATALYICLSKSWAVNRSIFLELPFSQNITCIILNTS